MSLQSSTHTRRTACNRDCPDACSLIVEFEGEVATKIKGDKEDPFTQGFLCPRTSRFLTRQYAEDRFLSPLIKMSNRWSTCSWETALDLTAERMLQARETLGSESIFTLKGGGSLGILNRVQSLLFKRFGPTLTKKGDVCSGNGEAAQERDFGVCDMPHPRGMLDSKLIVCWGRDVHTTNIHLLPYFLEAKKNGTVIVNINTVGNKMSRLSDLDIRIAPGGDAYLALAVSKALYDEGLWDESLPSYAENIQKYSEVIHRYSVEELLAKAGVKREDYLTFVDLYKSLSPSCILLGWGLTRRSVGGFTVRAIDALAVVSGNIGLKGTGVHYYHQRKKQFSSWAAGEEKGPQIFENRLGQELLDHSPDIQVAWISGYNPVTMLAEGHKIARALRDIPWTVVVDTHPNDTTDCADLILPTRTLLEDDNLVGSYGSPYYRESFPVLKAPEGCWHEIDIVNALATRLGVTDFPLRSIEEWKNFFASSLEAQGWSRGGSVYEDKSGGNFLFEGRAFPTPSGKARLLDVFFDKKSLGEVSGSRFVLQVASHPDSQSSQWSVTPPKPSITLHSSRGYQAGRQVLVSANGVSILAEVQLNDQLHPSIAWAPKGLGFRQGSNWNCLLEARPTDLGDGSALYDQIVSIHDV